ncbi:MAG: hypothetical protein ABIH42_04950 [Planctomycetota bacterium]
MNYRTLKGIEKKYLFDVFKLTIMLDCIWYFKRGNADDFYEKRKIDYLNKLEEKNFIKEYFIKKRF